MKRIIVGVSILFLLSSPVLAEDDQVADNIKTYVKEAIKDAGSKCPKTTITGQDQCLKCHVAPTFALRESNPDDLRVYPKNGMKIINDGGKLKGYLLFENIDANPIKEYFDYLDKNNIDHAIIEIQSPGGSLFEGWRVVGLFGAWETAKEGRIIETQVHGFAASAGFLVFVSGTIGHRKASSFSQVMWHEISIGQFQKITTPSSSEEESKVLRHLQNTANNHIASRSKLSKEEWDKRIHKRDYWFDAREGIELGVVDCLLGCKTK